MLLGRIVSDAREKAVHELEISDTFLQIELHRICSVRVKLDPADQVELSFLALMLYLDAVCQIPPRRGNFRLAVSESKLVDMCHLV